MQIAERAAAPSKQKSERWPIERQHLCALAVLCVVAFFYGLGALPFLGPDEPRYAQVAREMYASGDWITPRLAGLNWFEKPALTYWLAALGYILFGVSEFAARAGVALLASGGVMLLYWFGRRVHSAQFGYLSAAALLSCGLWPGFARGTNFDLPLSVCLEVVLLSFFLWERQPAQPGQSNHFWWLCCAALGWALLAKGLVGLVLPGAIIGIYLLLTRRLLVVWQPRLLLGGALLLLAIAALWYAPMLWRHGQQFINEFFIAHHFQRYTSNKFKHPQPFYFFFLVVLLGSFPWTPFLLSSIGQTWRERRGWLNDETQRLRLFLWLWVLVPLFFFSFSGSKLPGYILPVFPAIALLIGQQLLPHVATNVRSQALVGVALLFALLAVLVYFAGVRELGLSLNTIWLIAGLAVLLAGILLALNLSGKTAAAVHFVPVAFSLLVVLVAQQVFPALGRVESLATLAQQANQAAQPGERLIFYINAHHSVDFYAPQLPLRDDHAELTTAMSMREINEQVRQHGSLLVMTPQRWSADLTEANKLSGALTVEVLGRSSGEPRCTPGCDWLLLRARPKN